MKSIAFLLLVLTVAFSNLYAEQENFYPKGIFEYSPPSRLRAPKLNVPGSQQRDIQVWSDSFETNNGWSLTGCWQRGPVEIGPAGAHGGAFCMGTNLNGLYDNEANITATSVTITVPAASYVELSFYEWFELESGYDYGYVEVSGSGNYRLDARTGTSGNQWRQTALNLTQFAGQTIRLIFRQTSDISVPGAGWYIDDLNIIAQEPLPITLDVTGVNTSNHPSIYINAVVNSATGPINDLVTGNFAITENEVAQTTDFTVITPNDAQQSSSADIVFVLDVTGSMGEEIASVKQNMLAFVNSLTAQNVDYRIGLVVFGDIVYIYNNYGFYTVQSQILSLINAVTLGEHGIGSGGDSPENQVEAMAEGSLFNWRPGAARVLIMLTDATTHQNDSVTTWTIPNLLAQRLLPNDIIVFPIFDTDLSAQLQQYQPIALETNPEGTYYDIYDNFNAIISQIGTFIGNIYTIHYVTTTPADNPVTSIVRVTATRGTDSAEDYCYYLQGMSPTLSRPDMIIGYDTAAQPANVARTITVYAMDVVPPGVQTVWLYWRHSGQTTFTQTVMSMLEPGYYSASISATQMTNGGIEYYFGATDGQSTNTLPSANPTEFPYSFAVTTSAPAVMAITSQSYNSTSSLTVNVTASSAQTLSLKLYYRPMGSLVYDFVTMTHGTGNAYTGHVTQFMSDFGMQYFVKATAANGLITYKGFYDEPYLIRVNQTLSQDIAETLHAASITDLKCMPNPVSAATSGTLAQISFRLTKAAELKTSVYNVKGERIRTIVSKDFGKGTHSLWWDLSDDRGAQVGSGLYLYVVETADQKLAGKLLILK